VDTVRLIPVSNSADDLMPIFGSQYSACFDIKADIKNRTIKSISKYNIKTEVKIDQRSSVFVLEPGARALIPTGFIFELPESYSMRLHPRSGLGWKKGICLMNGEGVIDWDYPNETFVMLFNTSTASFNISHSDRIAQAELVKMKFCKFDLLSNTAKFNNTSTRDGGFGSTGV